MKKVAVLLSIAALAVLASCGAKDKTPTTNTSTVETSTSTVSTSTVETSTSTEDTANSGSIVSTGSSL